MTHQEPLRDRIELALVEFGFNPTQAEHLASIASNPLFLAIHREQERQVAKWGEQNHPSFTSVDDRERRIEIAELVKASVDSSAAVGSLAWEQILTEELVEAQAEIEDPTALKTELIQVAAVALSWIESVERKEREEDGSQEV